MKELIDTANRMGDLMSTVDDAESARRVGAECWPLEVRHGELIHEIAALRLRLTDQESERLRTTFSSRAQAATERWAREKTRLIGDHQLMLAWNAGQAEAKRSAAPPPPPSGEDSKTDQLHEDIMAAERAMYETWQGIGDLLVTVRDPSSAEAARPALRQHAANIRPRMKKWILAVVLIAGHNEQLQRMAAPKVETLKAQVRMQEEITRVYHDPNCRPIRGEIKGVLQALRDAPSSGLRRQYQRWMERAKLEP